MLCQGPLLPTPHPAGARLAPPGSRAGRPTSQLLKAQGCAHSHGLFKGSVLMLLSGCLQLDHASGGSSRLQGLGWWRRQEWARMSLDPQECPLGGEEETDNAEASAGVWVGVPGLQALQSSPCGSPAHLSSFPLPSLRGSSTQLSPESISVTTPLRG